VTRPDGTRGRTLAIAATVAFVLVVLWLSRSSKTVPEPEPQQPAARVVPPQSTNLPVVAAAPAQAPVAEASSAAPHEPTPAEQRLARAKLTLETYLKSNRLPPDSRPMSEHPDMETPHWVPQVSLKIKRADGKKGVADVILSQDRRFLVGDEVATLSMKCRIGEEAKPCKVYGAWLKKLVDPAVSGTPGGQPVTFSAGADGAQIAKVQPSTMGFAGFHGLLRVDVALDVGSETGATGYQLELTPDAPATFTGTIEEAMVDGTLNLFAGVNVKRAGRYVFYARVDDAKGRTFAFLSVNQEFAVGEQKVPYRLFGRLVRDEKPEPPYKVRDLEGFRLIEDQTPDREILAAREGVVHVTKSYPIESFSETEWDSPDKKRYVEELQKDLTKFQGEVQAEKTK